MKPLILTPEQVRKLDFIKTSPSTDFSTLLHFELKELAVYWSFYSGKIEGNTYSFYETEDYGPYTDFALNSQIERINEVAPPEQRYAPGE